MKLTHQQHANAMQQAASSLAEALLSLPNGESVLALLDDLCTPAELEAIIDRWRVALLLDQGHPYREIHDLTGVSVTTVGRVARFAQQGAGGYRQAIECLQRKSIRSQTNDRNQ